MKRLIWKFKYAKHLKGLLGLSIRQAWSNAESALENINNDLEECPVYSAEEEYYQWCSDSVGWNEGDKL